MLTGWRRVEARKRVALGMADWVEGIKEGCERERRAREWGSRDYNIGARSKDQSELGHILSCVAERAFGALTGLPLPSRVDYDGSVWDFRGPSGVLVNVKASDRLGYGISCTPERFAQRWHPSVEIAVKICVAPGMATVVGWLDRQTFETQHHVWEGPDYTLWVVDASELWGWDALVERLGFRDEGGVPS